MAGVLGTTVWLPGPRAGMMPLTCAIWAFGLAAVIDARRKPATAFRRARRSRGFWGGVGIASVLAPVIAAVYAVIWFVKIRPEIVAAVHAEENRHSHTRQAKGRSVH